MANKCFSWDDYLKWWEKERYSEEHLAPLVIERVLGHHEMPLDSVKLYPRFLFRNGRERIEFDLVIEHERVVRNKTRRWLVGIEFKETDFSKAVAQAMVRRRFVDYMYIATRSYIDGGAMLDQFFMMQYFGIGWVVWGHKEAFMVFPARWSWPRGDRMVHLLDSLVRARLTGIIESQDSESVKEIDRAVTTLKKYLADY